MTPAAKQALGRIPGWEGATFSELAGGLTNRTFLVDNGKQKAVLKVDVAVRCAPFSQRMEEKAVQSAAADKNIANRVLYADELTYLTEFVEGQVWTKSDLNDEKNLVRLAQLLRRLHSQPLTGRTFDAGDVARAYTSKVKISDSATARHCVETVTRLHAPHNLCCCHNDLVAENIIATPELRLIDWEYACDNDPMSDLAIVIAHHELPQELAFSFLDHYFDGDGRRWRDQLARQVRLYNALLWLWYAARPDHDPVVLSGFEKRLV